MKTIGMIGGMSAESTAVYYKLLNEGIQQKLGGLHSAQCLLYSVDFDEYARLQGEEKWAEMTDKMIDIAKRLKQAGADFLLICTNTMHLMADDVQREAGISVLHIADAAGQAIRANGFAKVGLLGTKFTMERDFYKKVLFERHGIQTIIPDDAQRETVHRVIYDELCKGELREASKQAYLSIIDDLRTRGAQGVVLGCTEIPLLVQQEDVSLPLFDTTTLHANAAVRFALE